MSNPDDRDMLAAEYVLGTLDAAERADVASRLSDDMDLARAIAAWEHRLSPLLGSVPEISPPVEAFAGILTRLFGTGPSISASNSDAAVAALRRRVRLWRSASAGFALMAAGLLAWIVVQDGATASPGRRFIAVLQRDAGAPTMVVDVDLAARRLTVRPLAAAAPDGRAYELWIIDPTLGTPRSLGLVPQGGTRDTLKPFGDATIANATYAVTVEPAGGSPTGLPTTPPVLSGKLSAWPS